MIESSITKPQQNNYHHIWRVAIDSQCIYPYIFIVSDMTTQKFHNNSILNNNNNNNFGVYVIKIIYLTKILL